MGESTGQPNKELTLFGYMSGENAGPVKIITRYYASVGNQTFGESETILHPGGNFNWQAMVGDIQMPGDQADITDVENNPRAMRIFIRHSPPSTGAGKAIFDELAIINWETALSVGEEIVTPHARDFLRIEGPPGKHHLSLTFRQYQPHGSFFVAPKVQANGEDFLRADSSTKVALTVSLEHRSADQKPVDWWITADTNAGVLSYVYPDGWKVGEHRTILNPLLNFNSFPLFEGALPPGKYPVEFCIDDNRDNIKDCTWKDMLNIYID